MRCLDVITQTIKAAYAEGFKVGQEAMQDKAAHTARLTMTAASMADELTCGLCAERIRALPIEEPQLNPGSSEPGFGLPVPDALRLRGRNEFQSEKPATGLACG